MVLPAVSTGQERKSQQPQVMIASDIATINQGFRRDNFQSPRTDVSKGSYFLQFGGGA